MQNLSDLLIAIRKPQDISAAHLEALNVDVQRDVPYADLVPKILEIHSPSSGGPRLSNGHPAPDQKVYEGLKSELLIPNDDAFREVNRMLPRPDREKPRVTQSRRFWAGLERMSQYWDTSLDEFYEVPTDDDNSKNNNELSGEEKPKGEPPSNSSKGTDGSRASNPGKMKRVYKGRRISTGKDMPEDCRDETIRRFLEMVVWPFRCQVVVPNVAPRITVGNVLFPVRHTFTAARSPEDYQMARKGVLEGPLLAVQCRGETTFRSDGEGVGDSQGEKLDLFREIGGMLLLAQGRAREGREEKRPGEGKWWVTVPRWGGGPGGDMETLMVEGEETAPVVEPEAKVRDAQPLDRSRNKRPRGTGQGPARRLSMAERWKILQPGPSLWDKKVKYMRIGANREMEEDDVSSTYPRKPYSSLFPTAALYTIPPNENTFPLPHTPTKEKCLSPLPSPLVCRYINSPRSSIPHTNTPRPPLHLSLSLSLSLSMYAPINLFSYSLSSDGADLPHLLPKPPPLHPASPRPPRSSGVARRYRRQHQRRI